MNVICVIGDVVHSRSVEGRGALQKRFKSALKAINQQDERVSGLLSPCTLTLGDEFQAVYGHAGTLWADFFTLLSQVYPVRLRFSVGVGRLDTPINTRQALGMDGPAFHLARAGMDSAFKQSGCLFRIQQVDRPNPAWLDPALMLLSREVQSWKALRFEIFKRIRAGENAQQIAQALGITDKAVYKNIQAGAFDAISGLHGALADWIRDGVKL